MLCPVPVSGVVYTIRYVVVLSSRRTSMGCVWLEAGELEWFVCTHLI